MSGRDTGMGRGDEQIQQAISRLVRDLDTETDKDALAGKIERIRNGPTSRLTGSRQVVEAVESAERRLRTM